jgi:hypothetical protein
MRTGNGWSYEMAICRNGRWSVSGSDSSSPATGAAPRLGALPVRFCQVYAADSQRRALTAILGQGASGLRHQHYQTKRRLGNRLARLVIFGRVEHLAELEPAQLRHLPFAVVDFDPGPSISSVRVDGRAGCYAAAKYLIEHGQR